jgi:hypothetical protein
VWGSGGINPPLLTSALDGSEWSDLCPGHFTPGINWIGGWVGFRVGLDALEERKISCPAGDRTPDIHPLAHRYPSSPVFLPCLHNSVASVLWIGSVLRESKGEVTCGRALRYVKTFVKNNRNWTSCYPLVISKGLLEYWANPLSIVPPHHIQNVPRE